MFMRALAGAGRSDEDERPNLFAEPTEAQRTTAYEIGGLVHDVDLKLCGLALNEYLGVKGKATIAIQWQIYSPAKREVVATIETTGASSPRGCRASRGISRSLSFAAFSWTAPGNWSLRRFKTLMDAPPPKDELRSTPGEQEKTRRRGRARPAPRPVARFSGARWWLIVLPDGHGSGVLISNDGHILTNAHVVGQRQTVKVRWSDGYESGGTGATGASRIGTSPW